MLSRPAACHKAISLTITSLPALRRLHLLLGCAATCDSIRPPLHRVRLKQRERTGERGSLKKQEAQTGSIEMSICLGVYRPATSIDDDGVWCYRSQRVPCKRKNWRKLLGSHTDHLCRQEVLPAHGCSCRRFLHGRYTQGPHLLGPTPTGHRSRIRSGSMAGMFRHRSSQSYLVHGNILYIVNGSGSYQPPPLIQLLILRAFILISCWCTRTETGQPYASLEN
jgi:hypothetical protein